MEKHLHAAVFGLILLGTSTYGKAQIVLNSGDLPVIGDVEVIQMLDSAQASTVLPGNAGPNQVWNFGSLVSSGTDTVKYVNASTTLYSASFPSATIAGNFGGSFQKYDYYIQDLSGMKLMGGHESNTFIFDSYPYEFPIVSYGNSANSTLRYRHNIVSGVTFDVYHVDYISQADGWGSITTPAGAINAIRVYTTETLYDSSYVAGAGVRNSVQTTGYSYKWFAKNLGWPVLTIENDFLDGSPKVVRYASSLSGANGIKEVYATDNNIIVFPNPFTASATISTSAELNAATLKVFDLTGRQLKLLENIKDQLIPIDRKDLPNGMYFYELSEAGKIIGKGKLIAQ